MIVTLTKLWLVNAVTQETNSYLTDPARTQAYSVAGAIRTYAAGRQRAVGTVGMAGQRSYTLIELTLPALEVLKVWMKSGVTVLGRDHRGQSFYATFFDIGVDEKIGQGANAVYAAKITFQLVDVVEGV